MKTKYINSLLYLIVNNSLKLLKKNSQILFKKRYLELLNFLKKIFQMITNIVKLKIPNKYTKKGISFN